MNRKQAGIGLGVGVAAFVGLIALSGQYVPPTGPLQTIQKLIVTSTATLPASTTIGGKTPATYTAPCATGERLEWDGSAWICKSVTVTSSPDGSLSGTQGQQVTNSTTGVTWKNRAGSTRWDPVSIPPLYGMQGSIDFEGASSIISASNIGGGTNAVGTPLAGRPGVRRLTATAASTDGSAIYSQNAGVILGAGVFVVRGAVAITTLSDGTDRVIVRIGAGDATTFAEHSDGVYLEYDLANNGNSNWWICASSNGTESKADTGIAPVAGVYQNVEIRVNAAGTSVTAEIDGVAAPTPVTANIPTGAGRSFAPWHVMLLKSLGSSARTVDVDWMSYYYVFTTARGL